MRPDHYTKNTSRFDYENYSFNKNFLEELDYPVKFNGATLSASDFRFFIQGNYTRSIFEFIRKV